MSDLTDTQLQARHNYLMVTALQARADGDEEEAYRIAQEIRKSSAEMRIRMMVRAA